jgi:hypothetical protein
MYRIGFRRLRKIQEKELLKFLLGTKLIFKIVEQFRKVRLRSWLEV